jgi:UDP-N-acetylmuramyl pentapeptide phosphotransferase/UDP-N-acetylglucosamine-1-phosphate transferase/glycosyltransferase involved in cell wall biosynthesis
MSEEIRLAASFVLALGLAAIATQVARRVAIATSFYDHPKGYKAHPVPTPYLGGAAVFLAAIISTLATLEGGGSELSPVLGAALVLFIVGTLDDRVGLGISSRFAVQALAALALWAAGSGWHLFASEMANLGITLFWVIGLVNAFNLMDNQDGATGAVGAVAAGGAGILAFSQGNVPLACLALALSGACLGFLPYNLARPSRIFLGDGGSMPLGLIVAAVVMAIPHQVDAWGALLAGAPLAGIVIFDTSLIVFSRWRRGVPILNGARDHITHRLLGRFGSARRVALVLAGAQAALCGLAAALYQLPAEAVIAAGVIYIAIGVAVMLRFESWLGPPEVAGPASPIRVLHVIARLNMGGPAQLAGLLSGRRFDPERFETLLAHGSLAPGEESMSYVAEGEGARTVFVPELTQPVSPIRDIRALIKLAGVMRRFRPHIVNTHTAKAGFIGRVAALLFVRPRPVIVHTYHGHVLEGYFGPLRSGVYRRLGSAIGRASDCLISVSQATVDDLVRLGVAPRERFRVIPLGLDLEPFERETKAGADLRAELGTGPKQMLFSYVGRLAPIKRVDLLLRAFARANGASHPAHLLIVGDGEIRPALERLARELRVDSRVHFLGYRRDVRDINSAADAAVLSSENEGTPVSVIEAAASGRPAVVTAVGGVPEVVSPETGILVEPGDEEGLARGMNRIARNRELLREMGERAQERALRRYSAAHVLEQMARLYESLLASRSPSAPTSARQATGSKRSTRTGSSPATEAPSF